MNTPRPDDTGAAQRHPAPPALTDAQYLEIATALKAHGTSGMSMMQALASDEALWSVVAKVCGGRSATAVARYLLGRTGSPVTPPSP